MLLLFFAFLSGLITILAPCIWPLLPIVLSSSTLGGHRRPLGITIGVICSFAVFTLSISYLVALFHIDANILRLFAVVVIAVLGIIMIVPRFLKVLEVLVSRLSGKFGSSSTGKSSGFWGGLITGLSLGIVWAPCAGPILATIATLSATRAVTSQTILVTIAYSLGVGVPLFAFATFGSILFQKSKLLNRYLTRIQQVFGVIMILTAFAILTNYDKTIETGLLNMLPSYSNLLTSFETTAPVTQQLNSLKSQSGSTNLGGDPDALVGNMASDFSGGTKWLNLPNGETSLSMTKLKGQVVLVDFWTYTCINCIRTLPFVTSWYDKYHDKGFTVIGVHSPEFQFEHETSNVEDAIKQFNIHYPVVQDNDLAIWNNYDNQYWPAEYLIDAKGIVRRAHFGEGEYDQTEKAIQSLLKEKGASVSGSLVKMQDQTPTHQITPETYLGSYRRQGVSLQEGVTGGTQTFQMPTSLDADTFAFGGTWDIEDMMASTGKNASLDYEFYANHVYLVMTPGSSSDAVKVFLDGKPVNSSNAGADVKDGVVNLDTQRLYDLINLHGNYGEHRLHLEFQNSGTSLYAFTFG